MEIEDAKYETLVAEKSGAESKVTELTATVAERDRKIEQLEAEKVKAEEERDKFKGEAETAQEATRVAAMKEERLAALGTGFRAKLDKLETTAKLVATQAAKYADDEWEARVAELEETLGVKRDAKLDAEDKGGEGGTDATAGLLFDRKDVQSSGVGGDKTGESGGEVTASTDEPSPERRQSVIGGLARPRKETARA